MKFQEKPSSRTWVVPCGQTEKDGQTGRQMWRS